MATALQTLRAKAKRLGVPSGAIRSADRDELETLIEDAEESNGRPTKKAARRAVKKVTRRPVRKATGRKSATKSVPAKSRKSGTAKRQTTRTRTTAKKASTNGYQAKGGRNMLEDVDFSPHEDWNPRPGSAPDRIIKALRKFRGNRAKVFDFLVGDIGDFVPTRRADGSAWEKGDGPNSRKGMLRYRISRTAWQFAMQTGQHEAATNRVEYGTGGTGAGIWKRQKAKATQKATGATQKRGRGRPKGSTTKKRTTTQKATQSRTRATARKPQARRAVRKSTTTRTTKRTAAKATRRR
jgi:hypothetical protein